MTNLPLYISIEQGLLVLICLLSIVFLIRMYAPNRGLTLVLRGWLVLTALAAGSGWLIDFGSMPPNILFFMAPQMIAIIYYLCFSKKGAELLRIPQWILVGFQSFRIFVEIILAQLVAEQLFPAELSFHGINFDILSGILGLGLALVIRKQGELKWKKAILAFNVVGLALLCNIVFHAVGAMPTAFQYYHYSVPNTVMALFPMQWLPFFLVPLAMSLHILSIRKVLYLPK